MARAWIFQANPDRFDVEGALGALETIHWRVPQRASELLVGDPAVIWRSGRDAGVVGVARVAELPHEAEPAPSESAYELDEAESATPTTRVALRVAPCAFVSKATVASIPQLGGHQILVAPMGTVFPLDDAAWEALQRLLPQPPAVDVDTAADWPRAFAWEQRTKSVTPLPGGIDAYQEVLHEILAHVDDTQPARDELEAWIRERFEVSERSAALVTSFLGRAGLLRLQAVRVALTPDGERWQRNRDPAYLLAVLHGRVRYIGEMLAHLDEPRSLEDLLRHANDRFGMRWSSRGQITRSRQALGGLGALELDDEGRLVRTTFGTEALTRLDVARGSTSTQAGDDAPAVTSSTETPATPVFTHPGTSTSAGVSAAELVERLQVAAHDSSNPTDFEHAARDAFAFLGFDAVWHGGSGRTDVLLTAPLGSERQYRVVVDTKSTASEAVSDHQIDWVTIDEHKDRYEADHACIVAPAFRSGRLIERARTTRAVALLDVATLGDILRQHEVAPLDLGAYRGLFDPEVGPDGVIDRGESLRRELVLAAEVLRAVSALEGDEGVVQPSDLYWNLDVFADQFEGERAEREEIRRTASALAGAPFFLLTEIEDGFISLGSPTTQSRRLRLLADLIETGVPETSDQ